MGLLQSTLWYKRAGDWCGVIFLVAGLLIALPMVSVAYNDLSTQSIESNHFNTRPALYVDCQMCDYNYIRQEISFVNFARDQEQADIHLFITAESTGGGGREYELTFMGRRDFSDMNYEYVHQTGRNMTADEIRESLNKAIRMGLAPFMMKTPLASRFELMYDEPAEDFEDAHDIDDPWNNWVFEVYVGRLQLNQESRQSNFDSRWGFIADHITHDWKVRFRPYFNYHYTEIDQEDDDTIISRRHRHGLTTRAIRSLTDHWSAGLFGNYLTRNDRNLKHQMEIAPGVEYSLFPYDEATRRAVTMTYRIGYTYNDYYDLTIFDQTEDQLANQRLQLRAQYTQPWGNVNAGITGSHYFHDTTLRRLSTFARISVRLAEGLSLNLQGDYDVVQDQLTLRAGDLALEDIIVAQQELATDYSFRVLVAISYTFGSSFANIVNTRF